MANQEKGLSEDTKTIITILLLIFTFPIGIIMMWVWMKWPKWLKVLLTSLLIIPIILAIIGIIAVIFLVLKPKPTTDFLPESRDALRIADLETIKKAVDGSAANNYPGENLLCNGFTSPCQGSSVDTDPNVRKTDGSGWVKVKTDSFPLLPLDPLNNPSFFYTYCSDGKDWEIQAKLESSKFRKKASEDGGDKKDQYEVGTNLKLCQ